MEHQVDIMDGVTHFVPPKDEKAHLLDNICWCQPTIIQPSDMGNEQIVVIHYSADMRELLDQAESIKDQASSEL